MSPQALRALRNLARLANQLEPRTRDAFQRALAKLQLAADVEAAAKALATGDVEGALRALMPDDATAVFSHELTVAVARIVAEVGPQTAREIAAIVRVDFQFIPGSQSAARAMQRMDLSAILPVQRDAEAGLRKVLTDGLLSGENPRIVARTAREFISLTPYDADLIQSFETQLRNDPATALTRELRDKRFDSAIAKSIDGPPLSNAQVTAMRDGYTRKLTNWRAETWSRTTSLQALRETQNAAWLQAADDLGIARDRMQKQWITTIDGRERPSHHQLNGDTVPIDQPFANGDMVPGDGTGVEGTEWGCRCVMVVRLAAA